MVSNNDPNPLLINQVNAEARVKANTYHTEAKGTLNGHPITVIFDSPIKLSASQVRALLESSRITYTKDEYGIPKTIRTFVKYQDFNIEIQHGEELKGIFKNIQQEGRKLSALHKGPKQPGIFTRVVNAIKSLLPQNWVISASKQEIRDTPPSTPRSEAPAAQAAPPQAPPKLPIKLKLMNGKEVEPVERENLSQTQLEEKMQKPGFRETVYMPIPPVEEPTYSVKVQSTEDHDDLMPVPKAEVHIPQELKGLFYKLVDSNEPRGHNFDLDEAKAEITALQNAFKNLKPDEKQKRQALLDLLDRFENNESIGQLKAFASFAVVYNAVKDSSLTLEDEIKALVNYSGSKSNNAYIRSLTPDFEKAFIKLHQYKIPTEELVAKLQALKPLNAEDKHNILNVLTALEVNSYSPQAAIPPPTFPAVKNESAKDFMSNAIKGDDATQQQRAEELAKDLSIVFRTLKSKVEPDLGIKDVIKGEKSQRSPHVKNAVAYFNQLSNFISTTILEYPDPIERRKCIDFCIKLRDEALKLNDFDSAMAIQGALNSAAISRLDNLPPSNVMRHPQLDPGKSYLKIRQNPQKTTLPLFLVLQDLTFIESTMVSANGTDYSRAAKVIPEYAKLKESLPDPLQVQNSFVNEIAARPLMSEDEMYNISLQRKPRVPQFKPPTL